MDGIKVVLVFKCIRVMQHVILVGDETESKLHSVHSVSEQSQRLSLIH